MSIISATSITGTAATGIAAQSKPLLQPQTQSSKQAAAGPKAEGAHHHHHKGGASAASATGTASTKSAGLLNTSA